MENPGLRTLLTFLDQIRQLQPATFTDLSEERNRGYGMVTRYLRFALAWGLIYVADERRTRGRYPSRRYALSDRGQQLLVIFQDETVTSGGSKQRHQAQIGEAAPGPRVRPCSVTS